MRAPTKGWEYVDGDTPKEIYKKQEEDGDDKRTAGEEDHMRLALGTSKAYEDTYRGYEI
jgi:hypothetical protein